MSIHEIIKKYRGLVDMMDTEILIAHSLDKTREFVLSYPEYEIPEEKLLELDKLLKRRIKKEPIAHLLGRKEFYGLEFVVNKYTLVPRPETEMMIEGVINLLRNMLRSKLIKTCVIDIGTGSGCIITTIAHNFKNEYVNFLATDISSEALKVAKKNAQIHKVSVKFSRGNLLSPFIKNLNKTENLLITANLPYLSKEIYESTPTDVKKYEPKSALYSAKSGLDHYERLLKQIKELLATDNHPSVTCFLEISPEQKRLIEKLIKSIFPKAKIEISKDLAGKWRLVMIEIK